MERGIYPVIIGSGSYIPTRKISNDHFLTNVFFDANGSKLEKSNPEIIQQFEKITGIRERRYVTDDLVTSDIAFFAARDALASSAVDPESLDYIIVAHNFGDIPADNRRSGLVPSLASRLKHALQIRNPYTIGLDIPFGCAGWLQGMIQADVFIRAGIAGRILIVGAETLSRVCDPHMIYADGAGAVILVASQSKDPGGILAHVTKPIPMSLLMSCKWENHPIPGILAARHF